MLFQRAPPKSRKKIAYSLISAQFSVSDVRFLTSVCNSLNFRVSFCPSRVAGFSELSTSIYGSLTHHILYNLWRQSALLGKAHLGRVGGGWLPLG